VVFGRDGEVIAVSSQKASEDECTLCLLKQGCFVDDLNSKGGVRERRSTCNRGGFGNW
jgi:hypothetical protein